MSAKRNLFRAFVICGILLLLAAMIIPEFMHPREIRSLNSCRNNLRQLDGAKVACEGDHGLTNGAIVTKEQLLPYLGRQYRPNDDSRWPVCPNGGGYTIGKIGESPSCSYTGHVNYASPF
jgi:hypothetical protein